VAQGEQRDGGTLTMTLSLIVFALASAWYVVPWLKARSPAEALIALIWLHVLRYVALQIHSAQKFGFAVSDAGKNEIAYGDVVGALIALAAIAALRYRARVAHLLVWLLVIESILDLINASVLGLRENLFASANGVTWLILTFYVPMLWVSVALMVWQLVGRRAEAP
jgi:hypothetical protein